MKEHHQYPEIAAENSANCPSGKRSDSLKDAVLRRLDVSLKRSGEANGTAREATYPFASPGARRLHVPATEVDCLTWLEQPLLSSDVDAVHWLALGGPATDV